MLTTMEAFNDWLKQKSKEEAVTSLLKAVEGLSPITAKRWLSKPSFVGLYLIGVQNMLRNCGYSLAELSKMHPAVLKLHSLVATGKVTLESLDKQGIPQDNSLRLIRGAHNPSQDRLRMITSIVSQFAESSDVSDKKTNLVEVPSKDAAAMSMKQVIGVATQLINSLAILLPIIEKKSNADERSMFRKAVGSETIFKTNNTLSRLCSETAMRDIQQGLQ